MGIGTTELIIIFGIVLLVFGANKIPQLAKGIGTGIRDFKDAMSGKVDEPKKSAEHSTESLAEAKKKKASNAA